MRHRTPLAVAVVGALLIGGATTGTTLAQWHDEAPVQAGSITSGSLSHTVLNGGDTRLGVISLAAGAADAASVTGTVRDTSAVGSKNLRQEIRVSDVQLTDATNSLSLSYLRLAVAPKSTASCPAAVPSSPAAGYASSVLQRTGPGSPTYDVCVAVAATAAAPASTGRLQLTFAGVQVRPDGSTAAWTSRATATVDLTVTSDAPPTPSGLACVSQVKGDTTTITWTTLPGLTYSLVNGGVVKVGGIGSAGLPVTITADQVGGKNVDLKVRAQNSAGVSTDSSQAFKIQFQAPKCEVS
jgi:hypothetical protein